MTSATRTSRRLSLEQLVQTRTQMIRRRNLPRQRPEAVGERILATRIGIRKQTRKGTCRSPPVAAAYWLSLLLGTRRNAPCRRFVEQRWPADEIIKSPRVASHLQLSTTHAHARMRGWIPVCQRLSVCLAACLPVCSCLAGSVCLRLSLCLPACMYAPLSQYDISPSLNPEP